MRGYRRLGMIGGGTALLLGAVAAFWPGEARPAPQADPFKDRVEPLLAKYCHKCHGPQKPKAGLDLTALPAEKDPVKARKAWKRVWDMTHNREMPPEDKPQPTQDERDAVGDWVEKHLAKLDALAPKDPGRVVLRRLNRVEYANTIRDLLALDFKPVEDFPSDDVGYGFDNIGDVLSLPPLLLEKYLAAAEKILDRAVMTEEAFKPKSRRFQAEGMEVSGGGLGDSDVMVMFANGEIAAQVEFPLEGTYTFRTLAGGDQAGSEPCKMALRVDGKEVKVFEVAVARDRARRYETQLAVKPGKRRVTLGFINDYYNPQAPNPRDRDRNLVIDYVDVIGPTDAKPPEPPESHKRIFVTKPGPDKPKRAAAREILTSFASKAFRRPAQAEEVEKLLKLFDFADQKGETFETSMKVALQGVLVSPKFLFRVEPERGAKGEQPLGDWELASRLSYFLWSSMPDAELFDLAAQGKLKDPKTLEAQARRMLQDPRARSLADNFALQWLQLRRLEEHRPDPKRFPAFDAALGKAMVQETVLFFESLLREDRSVIELVDANFTFLNERLARHYGIPNVQGPEMRRVELADPRRGGVLMMASVLTATSHPTRTSAVKRGKWVLETLLGTPPPPPLPDAGELKDETEEDRKLSLRQRLERHRADPSCASCHKRMDPIGLGFENYDGIGAWRDKDGRHAIDTAATLPDGKSFRGPVELKKLLVARRDDFARCLSEKMLTYALGRGVEYYDGPAVKGVQKALAANGYRFSTLVVEIVKSYPFRFRRAGEPAEVK